MKRQGDRIQLTYPLSKSEIISVKYLGGLIVQGGMTLYSFVFCIDLCVWISDDHLEDALPT